MSDTITVVLDFDFKGAHHTLESRLDLGPWLRGGGEPPDLHQLLARDNGIDFYSYEYEVMQMETPRITQAEGLPAAYLRDGRLDWQALRDAARERQASETVCRILGEHGLEEVLLATDGLYEALIAIYRAGREDGMTSPVDG